MFVHSCLSVNEKKWAAVTALVVNVKHQKLFNRIMDFGFKRQITLTRIIDCVFKWHFYVIYHF